MSTTAFRCCSTCHLLMMAAKAYMAMTAFLLKAMSTSKRDTRRRLSWHLNGGGTPTHGYGPSREAAMAAFAKTWRRELVQLKPKTEV